MTPTSKSEQPIVEIADTVQRFMSESPIATRTIFLRGGASVVERMAFERHEVATTCPIAEVRAFELTAR